MSTRAGAGIALSSLRTESSWKATVTQTDAGAHVTTGALPWAYAAVAPVPAGDGAGWIAVDVLVERGRIGLAMMGRSSQDVWSEIWLEAGERPAHVLLPTDLARHQRILVRNAGQDEPSVAIIQRMQVHHSR